MTPSSADSSSPLEALRQLKALLDQGAITSAEYDTLKQRLLHGPGSAAAPTLSELPGLGSEPQPPKAGFEPYGAPAGTAAPAAMPAPSSAELPSLLDMFQQTPPGMPASSPPLPTPPVSSPDMRGSTAADFTPPRLVPVAPVVVSAPAPAAETGFSSSSAATPAMPPLTDFLPPAAPAPAATPGWSPLPAPVSSPPRYEEANPAPVAAMPPPPFPPVAPPAPAPEPAFDYPLTTPPVAPAPLPEPAYQPAPTSAAPASRGALPKVLLVLGGLALLAVLAYLFLGHDHGDEHLTSLSKTAADSVAVRPETGPQAEQPTPPSAQEPEVVRSVPALPPAAAPAATDSTAPGEKAGSSKAVFPEGEKPTPAPAPASSPSSAAPQPATRPATFPAGEAGAAAAPATTPEDGDDEATTRARQALASYYADLQAPPFNAAQHFAATVERLYTRQNLTPAAIEQELNRSMFPEFKEMKTSIVPGTLRLGPPAADGTRTATYTEQSRAFRVSKNQHQRTRTQVRVRFDPDFKMTYMRQEKLLENTFEQ